MMSVEPTCRSVGIQRKESSKEGVMKDVSPVFWRLTRLWISREEKNRPTAEKKGRTAFGERCSPWVQNEDMNEGEKEYDLFESVFRLNQVLVHNTTCNTDYINIWTPKLTRKEWLLYWLEQVLKYKWENVTEAKCLCCTFAPAMWEEFCSDSH